MRGLIIGRMSGDTRARAFRSFCLPLSIGVYTCREAITHSLAKCNLWKVLSYRALSKIFPEKLITSRFSLKPTGNQCGVNPPLICCIKDRLTTRIQIRLGSFPSRVGNKSVPSHAICLLLRALWRFICFDPIDEGFVGGA